MREGFENLISWLLGEQWGIKKRGILVLGKLKKGKRVSLGDYVLISREKPQKEVLKRLQEILRLYSLCQEHQRNSLALEKVRNVVVKLSSSVGWKETLKILLKTIKSLIQGKFFSIFLVNRKEGLINAILSIGYRKEEYNLLHLKIGKGLVGWVIEHGKPLNIRDVRKEERYFKIKKETKSELVVPIKVGKRVIGAINIEDTKIGSFTEREERLLEAFASIAGVVIERARLYRSLMEHRLTLKELEVARKIQTHFLPKRFPSFKGYKLYGKTHPARTVGGDYFNFFRREREKLLFVIADVSGKGIPAALLTSFFHSAMVIFKNDSEISELVSKLNKLVYTQTEANQFITGIIGEISRRDGKIKYVNFGHNYPILIRNGKSEILVGSDLVLGIQPDVEYTLREISFPENTALYLYTDGAIEETCGDKEFGLRNLIKIVENHWEYPAQVMKSLLTLMGEKCGKERDDDITMMGIVHVGNR